MKLSIIVPVYNGERYLIPCLRSLIQSVGDEENREFILINDGSTDGTGDILDRFSRENPERNIRVIAQSNHGLPQSRRIGTEEAAGEYVGFLDADDWVEDHYHQRLLETAERTGADLVCGGFTEERDEKSSVFPSRGREKNGEADRQESGQISREEARLALFDRREVFQYAWNKLYRRDLLKKVNFPGGNPIGEDFILSNQAISLAKSIAVTDAAGYHYRIHEESMTGKGFGPKRQEGFAYYRDFRETFKGTEEEKKALDRYLMLEYMSFLLSMYRGKSRDKKIEGEILDFIASHRWDYIRRSGDGAKARAFAALLNPLTSPAGYRLWPRVRERDE